MTIRSGFFCADCGKEVQLSWKLSNPHMARACYACLTGRDGNFLEKDSDKPAPAPAPEEEWF